MVKHPVLCPSYDLTCPYCTKGGRCKMSDRIRVVYDNCDDFASMVDEESFEEFYDDDDGE